MPTTMVEKKSWLSDVCLPMTDLLLLMESVRLRPTEEKSPCDKTQEQRKEAFCFFRKLAAFMLSSNRMIPLLCLHSPNIDTVKYTMDHIQKWGTKLCSEFRL